MKCLITGGTGFVGSHVVERAIAEGWEVICPVRNPNSLRNLKTTSISLCSFDNLEIMLRGLDSLDFVIHLAGATRALKYLDYYKANVEFTEWLVKLLITTGVAKNLRRFVHVSSQAVAGPSRRNSEPVFEYEEPRPISDYGRSKLEGERAILNFKDLFPVTIVRPSTVFGPRDVDVLGVFRSAKFRIAPVVSGPDRAVSIIYVEDLADGILRSAAAIEIPSGEIFFLANSEPVVWKEFAKLVGRSMGYSTFVIPVPVILMHMIGKAGDWIGKVSKKPALIRSEKVVEMKQLAWVCSTSKANQNLRWQGQTPLKLAIEKTRDWYISQGWI